MSTARPQSATTSPVARIRMMAGSVRTASLRTKLVLGVVALGIVAVVAYLALGGSSAAPARAMVTRGSISRAVVATGTTKPVQDIQLGFESSGKITSVNVAVGDTVPKGMTLARLGAADLSASLREAEAAVAIQQARLDELLRGTRSEEIAVVQADLATAQQNVIGGYSTARTTLDDSYLKSSDAITNQIGSFFTGADALGPQLTYETRDFQAQIDAQNMRIRASHELEAWRTDTTALQQAPTNEATDQSIVRAKARLSFFLTLFDRLGDTLRVSSNLTPAQLTSYRTNLSLARTSVSGALTSITAQQNAVASLALAQRRAEQQLALKQAGALPEDVRAQRAAVEQAAARAQGIRATIGKTVITAPIAGVITKVDAKPGEIVSPSSKLISLISANKLEVEANVPEVLIGAVSVGNSVSMHFDAFPDETITGTVASIEPAETIIDGVVNYKVRIVFDAPDTRLKSGLTATVDIETVKKDDVLIVPSYTLFEREGQTFVRKEQSDGTPIDVPVVVGVKSRDGKAEVIGSLREGDVVLTAPSSTTP